MRLIGLITTIPS